MAIGVYRREKIYENKKIQRVCRGGGALLRFSGFYVLIINILHSVYPPLKNTSFLGGVHSSLLFDFQYVTPKKRQKCTPPFAKLSRKIILNMENTKETIILSKIRELEIFELMRKRESCYFRSIWNSRVIARA